MAIEASRTRKALIMLACIYLQIVTCGIIMALAVLYAEIIQVFNSNRSQASLVQSIYSGLAMSGGIFMSPMVKRFGPGPAVISGALIGSIGFVVASVAEDVSTIILAAGFIGSIGMCLNYLSAFVGVSWTFHLDPGFALVCVTVGSSFGQFSLAYLTEVFIEAYTWNGAFLLLSGMILQCVPCGCFLYTSRHFYKTDLKADDLSLTASVKKIFDKTLITDLAVLLILFNSLLLAFSGSMEAFYFVDIMVSRGYSREKGSFLVTMVGVANMFGRIIGIVIRFKVRIKTIYHWIYLWPIIAVSHLLAVTQRNYGGIIGACLLYGVTFGTCTAQNQAIIFDVCGLSRSPQGIAMVNLMYGIGNFCSSFIGGVVKDAVGQYDPMFYMGAAIGVYVSMSSAAVAFILRRRETRERKELGEEETLSNYKYKRLQYGSQHGFK